MYKYHHLPKPMLKSNPLPTLPTTVRFNRAKHSGDRWQTRMVNGGKTIRVVLAWLVNRGLIHFRIRG